MILVTGASGFLGQALLPHLKDTILFEGRVQDVTTQYDDMDITQIWHMAAPSTSEDFAKYGEEYLNDSIIKGTYNMISLANKLNAELIFFSTEGIYELDNQYCKLKNCATDMVMMLCKEYRILVIPRVYSKDRIKGLIGKLKRRQVPLSDMNKPIEYMDIQDFITELFSELSLSIKIILFKNKRISTVQELKKLYIA